MTFARPDKSIALEYNGLTAYDATGRVLPAWLEIGSVGGEQELLIQVNEAGAKGPITIDPFLQQAKLMASDGAAYADFGNCVGISGNTVVVGSYEATIGGNTRQGAAYVFVQSGSTWIQKAKLTASDGAADDLFGGWVAISGNTLVVGALQANAAYVFVEPSSGWATMTQTVELTASDGAEGFGNSVAISGNTVVVGAEDFGAAYVFVEPVNGWASMAQTGMTQTAKLTASDLSPGTGNFGYWVAIDGATVVVAARSATIGGNLNQGSAYVFVKPESGWVNMTQTAELVASDGEAGADFGSSFAISGDTVVVGASRGVSAPLGAAYVFVQSGSVWNQVAELTPSDNGGDFGDRVAISGNTVVVGAFDATVGGNTAQGAAYVFVEPSSGWANMSQAANLMASDGAKGDEFGDYVAISSDAVLVGAPGATVGGNVGQGAVYVFWGPQAQAITLTPGTLPADTVNVPYNQTITASGATGTVTWTWSNPQWSNPQGGSFWLTLSPNGSNLTISGTPTVAGTETFTVTATDSADPANTGSIYYSITVKLPSSTTLTDNGPNPSTVGQAVSFVVTVAPTVPDGETVTLEDASNGNAVVGTGTLTAGTVTISVSTLTAGTHTIFAVYGGDSTYAASQSAQVAQVVNAGPAPALSSATVNGANVTIAGQSVSLAGKQRSMVDDIVFQFNEAVTLDASAFTIALHSGVSVNGGAAGTVGTLPTLNWSSPDGGVTWVVTFSGAGVVGGSIADGDYDITVVSTAVHANGQTMTSDVTNTFFRLFGDTNGDGQVSGRPDLVAMQSALGTSLGQAGYLAYLDYNGDGIIAGRPDFQNFQERLGIIYTGLSATI